MGYLDNDSIIVDAILTKRGRKILADGGSLNISQFALSDDGVDYDQWNTDHPSGSRFYGDALTALPNLEAVPATETLMRYKLATRDRNTIMLPFLEFPQGKTITLDRQRSKSTVNVVTQHGSDKSGYRWEISDATLLNIHGNARQIPTSYTPMQFPVKADFVDSRVYIAPSLTISPGLVTEEQKVQILVTGLDSNSVATIEIILKKNEMVINR